MLAAGATDVLQADVGGCGGVTEWLRVVALAVAQEVLYTDIVVRRSIGTTRRCR